MSNTAETKTSADLATRYENVAGLFTEDAKSLIVRACEEAMRLGTSAIRQDTLLCGVFQMPSGSRVRLVFQRYGLKGESVAGFVAAMVPSDEKPPMGHYVCDYLSDEMLAALESAQRVAQLAGSNYISAPHIAIAMLQPDQPVRKIVERLGANPDVLIQELI